MHYSHLLLYAKLVPAKDRLQIVARNYFSSISALLRPSILVHTAAFAEAAPGRVELDQHILAARDGWIEVLKERRGRQIWGQATARGAKPFKQSGPQFATTISHSTTSSWEGTCSVRALVYTSV